MSDLLPSADANFLTPIFVCGLGRSGTTALMALLGSDPRTVLDRNYPYENCHLTYLAKLAVLQSRRAFALKGGMDQLIDFDANTIGGYPPRAYPPANPADRPSDPASRVWLASLWAMTSATLRRDRPEATCYAEKAPPWVAPTVREVVPGTTLYLFRDPRDIYLSANAFMRKKRYLSFGRTAKDSELDFARTLAHDYLCQFENYRADQARSDCCLVRYEDFVRAPAEHAERLGQRTGLQLTPAAPEDAEAHRTSASIESSVHRWQREPTPPEVLDLLHRQLRDVLAALEYPVPSAGPRLDRRALGFPNDLSQILAASPHGSLQDAGPDGLAVTLSGEDFFLLLPFAPFDAEEVREVWVALRGQTGDHSTLYWRSALEEFGEDRCLHVPFHPAAHWQIIRFRVGRHARWQGTVGQLRLDLFNGTIDEANPTGSVRWIRLVE